jgi:hypothetical protein
LFYNYIKTTKRRGWGVSASGIMMIGIGVASVFTGLMFSPLSPFIKSICLALSVGGISLVIFGYYVLGGSG